MPNWFVDVPSGWLVVPLMQADTLLGFVVLARARAMRGLTWEDHDLLKTAGRQIAGHLASVGLDPADHLAAGVPGVLLTAEVTEKEVLKYVQQRSEKTKIA